MHNTDRPEIDALLLRRVSAEEGVDPRSVLKVIAGGHVRGIAGARAHRAAQRLLPTITAVSTSEAA